mmetsp:Transcript_9708/g.26458  ORF Transcript_9708/g.26458 Transcript_9708/m.26458 type:complete len:225 (-) Transcript_9708:887-1561(-)
MRGDHGANLPVGIALRLLRVGLVELHRIQHRSRRHPARDRSLRVLLRLFQLVSRSVCGRQPRRRHDGRAQELRAGLPQLPHRHQDMAVDLDCGLCVSVPLPSCWLSRRVRSAHLRIGQRRSDRRQHRSRLRAKMQTRGALRLALVPVLLLDIRRPQVHAAHQRGRRRGELVVRAAGGIGLLFPGIVRFHVPHVRLLLWFHLLRIPRAVYHAGPGGRRAHGQVGQ